MYLSVSQYSIATFPYESLTAETLEMAKLSLVAANTVSI